MNVRVSTKKVIAQLEKKLADLKANDAAWDAYHAAVKKWEESVTKELTSAKNWSIVDSTFRTLKGDVIEVKFAIPVKLMKLKPEMPEFSKHHSTPIISQIEQALRILKMTDDETVSASTFNSITKFL